MTSPLAIAAATFLLAAAPVLAACGDDEPAAGPPTGPSATTAPDTGPDTTPDSVPDSTPGRLTIDDVEIPDDGESAGSLFGGASASAESVDATVDPDQVQEICQDPPCESDVLPPDEPPVDTFVPLPEHQPFCSLLADMEQRPLPDDEYEQVVVIHAWFLELREVTPVEIAEPLDVVIAYVDEALATQEFDPDPPEDDPIVPAIDTIGVFIDQSC